MGQPLALGVQRIFDLHVGFLLLHSQPSAYYSASTIAPAPTWIKSAPNAALNC